MIWELVPHVGLGPLRLGVDPDEYVKNLGFVKTEEDDDGVDTWAWFEDAEGQVFFQTCNGIIVTINSDGPCEIWGNQLHGLALEELRAVFADVDVVEEESEVGLQFEIEELELEIVLWEGIVETVGVCVDPDDVL